MLGEKLAGRYQIVSQLGGGAFGATFIALDTLRPGNPKCVVKQFKPRSTDPYTLKEGKRLFTQEAEILELLGKHDQIPQLLAHFEENNQFYLVQEFIDGQDLNEELPPVGRRLNENEVIELLQAILEVLAFVHQNNVIHRDIKPSNIRRRALDGKIVLIDFGAVKEVKGLEVNQQGQTVATLAIGTPGYMASEQANRNPKFSSDVYAVGIIGIQALTGINPAPQTLQAGGGLPTDPRTGEILWRDYVKVSPQFANVLDKMVHYYFPQRYQSASEALQALNGLTKKKNRSFFSKKAVLVLGLIFIILSTVILAFSQIQRFLTADNSLTNTDSCDLANPTSSTNKDFCVYTNSMYGININYPKTWRLEDKKDVFTGEVAKFLPPIPQETQNLPLEVTIEVIPQSSSLNEYTNQEVDKITQIQNVKIEDSLPIQLANKPGHEVIYTVKEEGYPIKRKAVWTLKNNQVYIITYTARESQYFKFLNTFQEMINTLEIK
jgi:eukaryotic-like serine/threonine-protein kinase